MAAGNSYAALRGLARWAFVGALALLVLSGWRKGRLVGPEGIDPVLLREPLQGTTDRRPFSFTYKSRQCRVRPVATYELWGLVVSHNNIKSVADIYHDASAVDTKDLCVMWGDNLRRPEYLRARYESGPFTCYVSWNEPLDLRMDGIGNNHMITDSAAVRRAIATVEVGDQVHFRGLLVNYQMEDWEDFWRNTSTVRTDSGCEVVFVEDLEVLKRGTPGWYLLWRLSWWVLFAAPVAYLVIFWIEAGKDPVSLGEI